MSQMSRDACNLDLPNYKAKYIAWKWVMYRYIKSKSLGFLPTYISCPKACNDTVLKFHVIFLSFLGGAVQYIWVHQTTRVFSTFFSARVTTWHFTHYVPSSMFPLISLVFPYSCEASLYFPEEFYSDVAIWSSVNITNCVLYFKLLMENVASKYWTVWHHINFTLFIWKWQFILTLYFIFILYTL